MKNIKPITAWVKGEIVTATVFNLRPIYGELFQFTNFYYQLLDNNLAVVADGNLNLEGQDYQAWGDDDYPYVWAAKQLNLTITGDYVPPIIEAVTPPIVE
jgi:hypothetical protein